jgi:hypothetical protein
MIKSQTGSLFGYVFFPLQNYSRHAVALLAHCSEKQTLSGDGNVGK